MKYLVTGGCGFIGSHITDALIENGHEVVVLDNLVSGKKENLNPRAKLIVGDIRNTDDLVKAANGIDGCFHMAAIPSVEESRINWVYTNSVNLVGTINIFDYSAKTTKFPVVFASSAAVYGNPSELPLSEGSKTSPVNAYGADKLACELHAKVAAEVHGVSNIGLRFFNVYGPRQDPKSPYSGVISIFSEKISNNHKFYVYGDGKQTRDFIYVADVVKANLLAMQNMEKSMKIKPDVYNVCTGRETSLLQLIDTLSEITCNEPDFDFKDERIGDIRFSHGNNSKAKNGIDFLSLYNLKTGLSKIIIQRDE